MKQVMFLGLLLYASLWAVDWSSYRIERVEQTNATNTESVLLRDERGFLFSVVREENLQPEQVGSLLQIKDMIATWTRIVPESVSFIPTEGGLEILVLPRVVVYKGQNFLPYLPAGMRFSWRMGLVYDFRMMIDTNLVRIRGPYESEDELLARMHRAVMYPLLYMRSEDMDVVLQKLESIEERQVVLEVENAALKKLWLAYLNRNLFGKWRPIADEKIDRVVALKKTSSYLGRKDIYQKLRSEGMDISQKEVDLILRVYFGE